MRKTLKILAGIILIISCQEKSKEEPATPISDFDLKTDLANFKLKMTELDTILISFNHSLCTYEAYERIQITKHEDSIQIKSEYEEHMEKDPKWELIYSLKIPSQDTIWDLSEFIKRNDSLKDSIYMHHPTMRISKGTQQISYSTNGLIHLQHFMTDYHTTMRELYNPEGFIYGYTEKEINDIISNQEE